MSFLTVPVSKEVIYFCWTLLYLSETMSSTKLEGIAKPSLDHGDRKSSYHVRQITTNFCNLVALNLIWNCVKDIRVKKIFKKIKFEGVWGSLEARNVFQRQSRTKYLRKTLVFIWNNALQEMFIFYLQGVFY